MELNGFPLYSSANSAASAGLKNFKTTNERFGAKSLGKTWMRYVSSNYNLTYRIMRRWPMPSTTGATNARKSEGVIRDGTARTPNITPSESESKLSEVDIAETLASSSSGEGLLDPCRNICTMPSGKLVVPDLLCVCGTKVASSGPEMILWSKEILAKVNEVSHLFRVLLPSFRCVILRTSDQSQSSQYL